MKIKGVLLVVAAAVWMASCTKTASDVKDTGVHKRYTVRQVAKPVQINADWDKPVWQGIEPIAIDLYMGDKPDHFPRTQAKLAWDDDYIYVIFRVHDRYVRAIATEHHGNVWQDSCVEFFFAPQGDVSDGYFNMETNCIGTILLHHQHDRGQGRRALDVGDLDHIQMATSLPKGVPIDPEITVLTVWTLEYALPWRMLTNYAPVNQHIRHVLWGCEDQKIMPRFFLRDNDILYPAKMDAILKFSGVKTVKTPFHAPNANAHAEAFVNKFKAECLDHLLIFGLNRLQRVVDCYTLYFNEHRPHQGIDNKIPSEYNMKIRQQGGRLPNVNPDNVIRKEFLGGLLKSYRRVA